MKTHDLLMAPENPYSPPAPPPVDRDATDLHGSKPLELSTSPLVLLVCTGFAVVIAAVAIMGLYQILVMDRLHWSMFGVVMLFGFCSYLFLTAYVTRLTIDAQGVRMQGFRKCNCSWSEIESWHFDQTTGGVTFVTRDGKEILVSNLAVSNRQRTEMVAQSFRDFFGPDSCNPVDLSTHRKR